MTKNLKYNFYKNNGYCILNLFNKADIIQIRRIIIKRLNCISQKRIFDSKNKKLEKYNELVSSNNHHNKLMNPDKRYIHMPKNIVKKILSREVLYILNKEWGHNRFSTFWIGNASKKQVKLNATGFRIARPGIIKNKDVGGVHADAMAQSFSLYVKNITNNLLLSQVTMWVPIVGFSNKYTLRLAPRCHKYRHINTSLISKKKITISFSKKYEKKFKFIRPNLKKGQGILLHPNLLHGSSINNGTLSRVSIDTRILNLEKFII